MWSVREPLFVGHSSLRSSRMQLFALEYSLVYKKENEEHDIKRGSNSATFKLKNETERSFNFK